MRKNYLALVILFCITLVTNAQQNENIEKGWEAFSKNEIEKGEALFKKELNGSNKAMANLALSFLEAFNGDPDKVHEYYKGFYANHPNPEPYIEALWSTEAGKKNKTELQFLEHFAKSNNPKLKALCNQYLGFHYLYSNDLDQASIYFNKVGNIKNWQLLGSFNNISESGFDKDFGVLDHPESNHVFKSKYNTDVKWFKVNDYHMNNWLSFDYHLGISNTINYAQTFINSDIDQEVIFGLGVSGSVKVWVNDKLLFSEIDERNNDIDTYRFTAKLNKGYNRVLIQIGTSEIDDANFLLRVLNKDGSIVQNIKASNDYQDYTKETTFKSVKLEDTVETFFLDKIKKGELKLQNYTTLAQKYILEGKTYKAKKLLKEALELYPDCVYIISDQMLVYNQDENFTGTASLVERIRKLMPNSSITKLIDLEEEFDNENFDKAEEMLNDIIKEKGKSEYTYLKQIAFAGNKKEMLNMISLVEEAYKKYPSNSRFAYLSAIIEEQLYKNTNKAAKVLENYLKDNYDESIITQLSDMYMKNEKANKALKLYDILLEVNPAATGYLAKLARTAKSQGKFAEAKSYLNRCLELAPYISTYYALLGQIHNEENNTSEAKKAMQTALYYNPNDYDTRELLRKISIQKNPFNNFEEYDVYELFKNAPSASDYPEENNILLLDNVNIVRYKNGGSEEKYDVVIKVFNNDGVDNYKEYQIPVDSNQSYVIEKAEVLKPNGSIIPAESSGTQLVFPNLEINDAIHVSYKLKNYDYGTFAKDFTKNYYINYYTPCLISNFSLIVPSDEQLNYKVDNLNLEPKITTLNDGYVMYNWNSLDNKAVEYEANMPSLITSGQVLKISTIKNWDRISKWYTDLAKAKTRVDLEVTDTTEELFKGKNNLSELEKVKTIYEYIVNEIRYISVPFLQSNYIPQKASKTLNTKQGDCKDVSTLFVSMCKSIGLEANLVLVKTRDQSIDENGFPSIGFNHCISSITVDNKEYYIELTSENLPFAAGDYSVNKSLVLPIYLNNNKPSEAFVLNSPNRLVSSVHRVSNVEIDGNQLSISAKNKKGGSAASSFRYSYENIGKEAQDKKMKNAILGNYESGINLIDFKINKGLKDNSDYVAYEYKYKAENVVNKIASFEVFNLPWLDNFVSPSFLNEEVRDFDITLWDAFGYEDYYHEITLNLKDKSLVELPKDVVINNDYFEYATTFKKADKKLIATRIFKLKNDVVKKEDYLTFKEAFKKVIETDNMQIAVK